MIYEYIEFFVKSKLYLLTLYVLQQINIFY